MKDNTIVIVGNGFDVGHGLPSRYSDFKEWLHRNDKEMFLFLDKYIDVSGYWWNDFERNLSEINVPKLISETPRGNSKTLPGMPPSFYEPACGHLDSVQRKINRSMAEWIRTLEDIPVDKKIKLPDANLYISFNYTDTLERAYDISENDILYIHGKASRGDELIYGHGKNQFLLEHDIKQRYGLHESNDFFTPGTYGDSEYQLTHHISYWQKYIQLANYYDVLRPAIKNANTVYVYGLSFSEVDCPYIIWIVEQNPSIRWRVSWHTEEDMIRISSTLEALRVKDFELRYM